MVTYLLLTARHTFLPNSCHSLLIWIILGSHPLHPLVFLENSRPPQSHMSNILKDYFYDDLKSFIKFLFPNSKAKRDMNSETLTPKFTQDGLQIKFLQNSNSWVDLKGRNLSPYFLKVCEKSDCYNIWFIKAKLKTCPIK